MSDRFHELQSQVFKEGVDGWLIYDFRGSNALAAHLLKLPGDAHLTRRYFVWIPCQGEIVLVHSIIESGTWSNLLGDDAPVRMRAYRDHNDLNIALGEILGHSGQRIAMEYSPLGNVPYVAQVDAGTVERIRSFGVEIVSSADLLQPFLRWSAADLAAHREAAAGVAAAKDAGFALIDTRLRTGLSVDELAVQSEIARVFAERGLETDHPAIVGFGAHAGNPHYAPTAESNATLQPGQCVLIDLWAQVAGHPFADATFMGCAGTPSDELQEIWSAVRDARDAALDFLSRGYDGIEGWQVDRVARDLLTEHGYGEAFTHRLGHSIASGPLHGDTANLDDFDTHDTRKLIEGTSTSIEPGVYLPERGIGVRTEIDVYYGPGGVEVTTEIQRDLVVLGP
jgi:Xaa-Pro aminopeptidase